MSFFRRLNEKVGRVAAHLSEEDRSALAPHRLLARGLRLVQERHAARGGAVVDRRSPLDAREQPLVEAVLDVYAEAATSWFRLETLGASRIPDEPTLFVGNHNGGLLATEGGLTGVIHRQVHGGRRRLYALAHDVMFADPVLRKLAGRVGLLRADPENALRALQAGHDVLVFPGSDYDAARPFSERNRIVLAGRTGFIKLALKAGVPIVPVVSAGLHEQMIVLTRGETLAKLLGMRKHTRAAVFPIAIGVPWGVMPGIIPYLPLPTQTSIEFGEPLRWPGLSAADADDPATVARCFREVETVMQASLDRLTVGRRFLRGQRARRGK